MNDNEPLKVLAKNYLALTLTSKARVLHITLQVLIIGARIQILCVAHVFHISTASSFTLPCARIPEIENCSRYAYVYVLKGPQAKLVHIPSCR